MNSEDWKKKILPLQELLDKLNPNEKLRDILNPPVLKELEDTLKKLEQQKLLMHPRKSLDELILSGTAEEFSKILKGINFPK